MNSSRQEQKKKEEQQQGKETKTLPLDKINELTPVDLNEDETVDAIFNTIEKHQEEKTLQELTSTYLRLEDFSEGEERRYIFTGLTEMDMTDKKTGERKKVTGVKLMDKDRTTWVCGAAIVVNSLRELHNVPCGVVIKKIKDIAGKDYDNCRVWALQ